MDKKSIKKFAVNARKDLIKQVKQKAYEIGIEEGNVIKPDVKGEGSIKIHNRFLDKKEVRQRKRLISEIDAKNYEQVMEEVAYTWFNRFVALRFMEINEYLPTGVRVLSSEKEDKIEPDIINEALNVDLDIDKEKVFQFQDNNNTEGLYKYLLIKQCNSLHDIMPFIFEKIADYTEILLPDNLLSEGSVIRSMVENIEESNWQEVEIIGWMYQFYISEKKDEVFGSDSKIQKDEIPAATQLFTPDWIVKYMVENSLGKYWLVTNNNQELKDKLKYYLEDPEQEPEVQEKLDEIRNRNLKPEEITVLDPACGSGHILVYTFEVLYDIYKSSGYMESEIPQLIINNNLYGLEICDRANQLSNFSVMMKAREKDTLIFEKDINFNICSIQETNRISKKEVNLLVDCIEDVENKQKIIDQFNYLIDFFKDAKMYGSIIKLEKNDFNLLKNEIDALKDYSAENLFEFKERDIIVDLLPKLFKQANIMLRKYDIVVTNPPYMGTGNMNDRLKSYLNKNKYSKGDIYCAFIERCLDFNKEKGLVAMITQHSWMFLTTYKKIREKLINNYSIRSMVHLGAGAFEEISGEVVQTTSFVLGRDFKQNFRGKYVRLVKDKKANNKLKNFLERNNLFEAKMSDFNKIPNNPIIYWLSSKMINLFSKFSYLKAYGNLVSGRSTGGKNKELFRYWFEVSFPKIDFNSKGYNEIVHKWLPLNKGGSYRKWYGNLEYVSDKSFAKKWEKIFDKAITWSDINTGKFNARVHLEGMIANNVGKRIYVENNYYYTLAFLNTKIVNILLDALIPTQHFDVGYVGNLPFKYIKDTNIKKIAKDNTSIAKKDWNAFEYSWDFKEHPLLTYKKKNNTTEKTFNNWSTFAEDQFYKLKENEEKLNEIFIDIYDLKDELDPEVPEEDVTVRKADKGRDIRSFISYAVGCMLGRYSLDEEGLVYAGGEFNASRYETFAVEEDNIIPILKGEYFENDIVSKFIEFVEVTFGKDNLEENLRFIADALIESGTTGKDTPRDTIRYYFLYDFIKDHVSTYNKRPIYWLFQSSGRRKAFNALIYMHRYDKNTVARVRTEYLHELQGKLRAEKARLQNVIDSDLSSSEKNKARKELKDIDKDMDELRKYDEKLNHIANKRIEIDLDDGVKENYKKFDEVLANI